MDRLESFETLGKRVAEEQDALLADANLDEVRGRVLNAKPQRRSARRRAAAYACGLAAAAALVLAILPLLRSPEPLSFVVGDSESTGTVGEWVSAVAQRPVPIRFSDGTQLVLDPGARARVVQVDEAGAHLVIESGRASMRIEPQPEARWRLSLGPFAVKVTGTRFGVAWSPEQDLFELRLYKGTVSVSGCLFGSGRPVLAGERLRAWCRRGRFEVDSVRASDGKSPGEQERSSSAPDPAAAQPPGAAAPRSRAARADGEPRDDGAPELSWKELASEGRYTEAMAAASAVGFEAECQRVSAAELAALADAARYAGQLGKASHAYQTLRGRFPGSGRAASAAYTLGRIAFDQQGSYGQAARWFRTYLGEQPGGGLAREALGRLMEATHRSGDQAGARRIAARYLKQYPGGPHAALAQKLVGSKQRSSEKR